MGDARIVHRVVARNTARSSPNKMHDDDVAKTYGFAGGLVPGVTIFAWMCGPALDAFGEDWLRNGTIDAAFRLPVYEGEEITIEGRPDGDAIRLSVIGPEADRSRASGSATPAGSARPDESAFARAALPTAPLEAGPESLAPGRSLGTLDVRFDASAVRAYLDAIGARHPATTECAHPGWLLALANLALASNVALGPWIHVSSEMRLHDTARAGEEVSVLSRVAEEFERKGHRFVALDLLFTAGDRIAAGVHHVAIYAPRRA